jgi:hypothetical protein
MEGAAGTKPDLSGHGLQGIRFRREPIQVGPFHLPGGKRSLIIGKSICFPEPFITIPQAVTGNIEKTGELFFFFGGHHILIFCYNLDMVYDQLW